MNEQLLFHRLIQSCRLKHIQLIVRIAELGSLQHAARSVGLSQPAATQAVAGLEAALGASVFERHAKGMRPTAHGLTLIRYAQHVLRSVHAMAQATNAFQSGASGFVRVVSVAAGVMGVLVKVLPEFNRRHPDIVVEVNAVDQAQLEGLLVERAGDLFICRAATELPEGYTFIPLVDDRFVVATTPDHPLCSHKRLALADCEGEQWLLPPPGVLGRQLFDTWCEDQLFIPDICTISSRSLLLSKAMIHDRHLLGVFPLQAIRQFVAWGELTILPLDIPGHVDALGMMLRTHELGQAGTALLEHAQAMLQAS
ncbi:MAG: LysR family transcriptional regulator [Pigmentiphaga sp.]|nr:LysR family transcriptional regulator [Pigmentiphaga sp.]